MREEQLLVSFPEEIDLVHFLASARCYQGVDDVGVNGAAESVD